jgi:hypothetical protein
MQHDGVFPALRGSLAQQNPVWVVALKSLEPHGSRVLERLVQGKP